MYERGFNLSKNTLCAFKAGYLNFILQKYDASLPFLIHACFFKQGSDLKISDLQTSFLLLLCTLKNQKYMVLFNLVSKHIQNRGLMT